MKTPSPEILTAGVNMFRPYFGDALTETRLVHALVVELQLPTITQRAARPVEQLLSVKEFCEAASRRRQLPPRFNALLQEPWHLCRTFTPPPRRCAHCRRTIGRVFGRLLSRKRQRALCLPCAEVCEVAR